MQQEKSRKSEKSTHSRYESNSSLIKQLLNYIEQEEEEKKLLYVELSQFVAEMEDIRQENQAMRQQLAQDI